MSFDEVVDRSGSDSSRWGGRGDVLALTIGDSDFQLPPAVEAAIRARMTGILGYDTVPDRLTAAISERLNRLYRWQVDPDWFCYLPGVIQGLNFSCRALTQDHESVVTEVPVYYPFLDAPLNAGRKRHDLPAIRGTNGWQFDFDGFEKLAADANCRLLMLCHPHNPLGRILDRGSLERIAEICTRHDVLICSDEIHADILFDGDVHVPMGMIAPERTVMLTSPSKAFAMSGLGGAFAIIPNIEIREKFESWALGLVPNISVLTLAAMQAAYSECEEWLSTEVAYLKDNRDYLFSRFSKCSKLKVHLPEATYFLWLDFRETGWNDPYQKILDHGVELTEGAKFNGPGYLRLNFASPRSVLVQAADRIERALTA
ncbi:MAG: aminotransferase class I/II-fold pyridoxal phosphate-dependent enzyme [Pseudomonadales bacterium]|nr:aminotransferase class I/II-fold pyridoxal phosphate-dependent enzyme [Pseudomonadales bacterium]MBO7004873.1 aminotransferase class I/II-fold pyridoxal phosphate-dependent enzyme [Pseudomonadales bacterium]